MKKYDGFKEDDKKNIQEFLSSELGKTLEAQVRLVMWLRLACLGPFGKRLELG